MGNNIWSKCFLVMVQVFAITSLPQPLESLVDSGGEGFGEEEKTVFIPDPMPPDVQETLQERLAALNAQFEALKDAEKEEIQQRVLEMREEIALITPPLPLTCPSPEPCYCQEDLAPAQFSAHEPWTRWSGPHDSWSQNAQKFNNPNFHRFPQQYHQFQYGPRFPSDQFENGLGRQMHGPMTPTAYTAQLVPNEDVSENDSGASSGKLDRSKRDLGPLRQTLSVTDPNEWWHNLDTSRSHGHWSTFMDHFAPALHVGTINTGRSSFMDHYAPALHVGTINRGSITASAAGGPKERGFGYSPDLNRGDWHAFKYKPRGQFQQYENKHLDYLKHIPNGLAGPAGSIYDREIPGYEIHSGQKNYYNYYGTPYYYNR